MIEKQVIFKERNASWTKFQENVYFIDLFENQAWNGSEMLKSGWFWTSSQGNMKFTEYTILNTIAFDRYGSKSVWQSRDQLISIQLPERVVMSRRPENSVGYRWLIRIIWRISL